MPGRVREWREGCCWAIQTRVEGRCLIRWKRDETEESCQLLGREGTGVSAATSGQTQHGGVDCGQRTSVRTLWIYVWTTRFSHTFFYRSNAHFRSGLWSEPFLCINVLAAEAMALSTVLYTSCHSAIQQMNELWSEWLFGTRVHTL